MGVILVPKRRTTQPTTAASINWQNPLTNSLLTAYIPTAGGYLDIVGGKNATDRTGSPTIQSVRGGYGLSFTTSDSYISKVGPVAWGTAWSFALWARFASSPASYGQFIVREAGAGTDWEIFGDTGNKRIAYGYNGGYLHRHTSIFSDTNWHFVQFVDDGTNNCVWYVDGVSEADSISASSAGNRTATGKLKINERSSGVRGNGGVGRVYLWNRSFSRIEAVSIYRDEWQLFAPVRQPIPFGAAASGLPTLSAAGMTGITASGGYPTVSYTY